MSDLFEFYNLFASESKKTIIFFRGNFTDEILHELAKALKNRLATIEGKKNSRRIFSIFIELAQNIYHYSAEKINLDEMTIGDGIVHIFTDDDKYIIQSGNVIKKSEQIVFQEYIDELNSKTILELKQLKKEKIRQERTREGAGFGLIEVILQSQSKLNCSFIIDENTDFMKIEVIIGR
jgi:hypothetical protein